MSSAPGAAALIEALRCAACRSELEREGESLRCRSCGRSYPIVSGIPVMIDEAQSVFRLDTFVQQKPTFFRAGRFTTLAKHLVPELGVNVHGRRNYRRLKQLLLQRAGRPRVLVLGGSVMGEGLSELLDDRLEIIESDVAFGPRCRLICDAHSIPFPDGYFDAVVAQAVLEHVADPQRCVAEMHRVLQSDGVVYAETPFMQQVHGGAYDFTRFTHLGYLRLFRRFEELESGAVSGPATTMAWAWQYLLLSLVPSRRLIPVVKALARWSVLPFKYLDYLVVDRPIALDGASGYYILARRSERELDDREIVAKYRGAL